MTTRHWVALCALALCICPPALRADPIPLVTLGDSLSASYAGQPHGGVNHSWTDLLGMHRAGDVTLHNFAMPWTTSTTLLSQGQHTAAVNLVQMGSAKYVTVAIGANDVVLFLQSLDPGNPATFDPTATAATLIGNVATTVATLKASGAKVVMANVPNIADTPYVQAVTGGDPAVLGLLGALTDAVNAQLLAIADAHRVPLIDLKSLNSLSGASLIIGGLDVKDLLYSIDGFHPSSLGSGLLANAEMEALMAYGVNLPKFTDTELLGFAGLTATDLSASFDVSPFVLQPAPEPSSLLLLGAGAAGLVVIRRRRQAAAVTA